MQHNDEDLVADSLAWQIIPAFRVQPTDTVVQKTHANVFYSHQLAAESLEICGAQTEYCVDTTTKVGYRIGYDLEMTPGLTPTAEQTIAFYKGIWNHCVVTMRQD